MWLVDPTARTLEGFALLPERAWRLCCVHRDKAYVRAEPFDALELDLALLWP